MAVTENAIRVQLPGGAMYAPAMHAAAAKTGARSGLSRRHATALNQLVKASVALLNSGSSSTIILEMQIHDDSISVKLTGKGCTAPTKKLAKQLETVADKKTQSFLTKANKSALMIIFVV